MKALDPGNYTARVRVISLAGEGPWTEPVLFNVPEPLKGEWNPLAAIFVFCQATCIRVLRLSLAGLGPWFKSLAGPGVDFTNS